MVSKKQQEPFCVFGAKPLGSEPGPICFYVTQLVPRLHCRKCCFCTTCEKT